jgi:molecular chaperone GrpE
MSELKVNDRRWWVRGEDVPGAEEPRLKPAYVEELEGKIAAKDAELQELIAKYRGASDEFDQARARLRKELSKDVERGRRSLIAGFLDVLDNLDRALDSAADRSNDPFVQGVSLVRQQFLTTLEGLGVRRVSALGQPFDPSHQEAVASVAATADSPAGTVVGIIRPGYVIGDEVLRPAQVAVTA